MSNLIKHKRVEFTELFYDLVFVYAISKTTALIHHLHHGIVTWEALQAFILSLLILVNTWMIQTVFTNRYGRNSMFNIVFIFIDMALLLLISSTITNDWQGYYDFFCLTVGTLSLTLFIQYLVQFFHKDSSQDDRDLIRCFLIITGTRTVGVYIAALFPLNPGFNIYATTIILTFLLPLFFNKKMNLVPINFPHLIERVSLLVIITFGEMIMGIADFFTPETFNLDSVLFFLIIVNLFMYYFAEFDYAIDESIESKGLHLIYSHYPIFIGLIMITVSFSFLTDPEANRLFVVLFLYTGLFLFQSAVLSNTVQNKAYLKYSKTYICLESLLFFIAFGLSLLFADNIRMILYITTAFVFLIEIHFLNFYTKQSSKHRDNKFKWL